MEDQIRGGNSCLFFVIKMLNLTLAICGVALIALGIWMWKTFSTFDIIQVVFICLGAFEFLMVLLAWSARKSVTKLQFYNIFMFVLFVAQLTAVIIAFALKDKIIDKVAEKTGGQKEINELKNHYEVVVFYCVGTLVLIFVLLVLNQCYIRSVKEKNFAYDYRVLTEDGRKISIQEKNERDRQLIESKYNQKREELSQKYPDYQKYRQGV